MQCLCNYFCCFFLSVKIKQRGHCTLRLSVDRRQCQTCLFLNFSHHNHQRHVKSVDNEKKCVNQLKKNKTVQLFLFVVFIDKHQAAGALHVIIWQCQTCTSYLLLRMTYTTCHDIFTTSIVSSHFILFL